MTNSTYRSVEGWSVGCTDEDRQNIWENLPHCQPRKMIGKFAKYNEFKNLYSIHYVCSHLEDCQCVYHKESLAAY
jgi:hypothetical protein